MAFQFSVSALMSSSFESIFSVVSLPAFFVICRSPSFIVLLRLCGDSSCDLAAAASFSSFATATLGPVSCVFYATPVSTLVALAASSETLSWIVSFRCPTIVASFDDAAACLFMSLRSSARCVPSSGEVDSSGCWVLPALLQTSRALSETASALCFTLRVTLHCAWGSELRNNRPVIVSHVDYVACFGACFCCQPTRKPIVLSLPLIALKAICFSNFS